MTTRRKLTVRGRRGSESYVTFSVEAYRGKLWITSYDCPFTCEAIIDPAQADNLVDLINQTIKEARVYRKDAQS